MLAEMSIAAPSRAVQALVGAVVLTLCVAAFVPNAQARKPSHPPVVFLVLDEFPGDTLLDRPGHIDAVRYPHFAALARHSTWFPNTQAVADMTQKAVPAILDGRAPRKSSGYGYGTHPNNLFTLAAAHGYRLHVREVLTRVCPRRLCGEGPPRAHWWSGRHKRFAKFLRSLGDERRTLWFEHTILPHGPWPYLPSGHFYPHGSPSTYDPRGFHDPFLTSQYQQRYTLQLGYVDRLVGRMLARLGRTGLFDKALIVVTADHGLAFDLGIDDRREATPRTIDEIAPVPLFIKAPHQRRARVKRVLARSVDLLPTIAGMLGWRVRWRVGGHSVFSREVRKRSQIVWRSRDFSQLIRIGLTEFNRRRAERVRRRVSLLGAGNDSLYRIGAHPALLGRPVSGLPVDGFASVGVRIRQDGFDAVDLASPLRPVNVAAAVLGGAGYSTRDVAVAMNGVVVATGHSFRLPGDAQEDLSVLMPERSLRAGANRVELFQVTPEEHLLRMREQAP